MRLEKKQSSALYGAMLFMMVYFSHDTLMFGTNESAIAITIRKVVPFFVVAVLLGYGRIRFQSKKQLYGIALFIILPMLSCVLNGEDFPNYIYRAVVVFATVCLLFGENGKLFCNKFNKIIYFLSIWSFFTFAIGNLFPALLEVFPKVTNIGDNQYYFVLFSVVPTKVGGYGLFRNMSLFREPGVLAVFLIIALVFELFKNDSPRFKYMLVYTIALITTFSTAGYIILAAIYLYVLINKKVKHRFAYGFLLLTGVLCILLFTDMLSAEGALLGKFNGTGNTGSWLSRLYSVFGNLQLAGQSPLWGVGRYHLYGSVFETISPIHKVVDNTNTVLINFAAYGIPYGLINFWGIWKFTKRTNCRRAGGILVLLVLLFQ